MTKPLTHPILLAALALLENADEITEEIAMKAIRVAYMAGHNDGRSERENPDARIPSPDASTRSDGSQT